MKSVWGRAMSESDCWANVNQMKINNVQEWLQRPAGWIKINDINHQPLNELTTNQDQCFQMLKKKKIKKGVSWSGILRSTITKICI